MHHFVFLFSDTLASSLEPMEGPKFDASLLANIPFKVLHDLLALSGIFNEGRGSSFSHNGTVKKSESLTCNVNYSGNQKFLDADSFVSVNSNDPATVRNSNVPKGNKETVHHSDKLCERTLLEDSNGASIPPVSSQGDEASVENRETKITSIIDPVVKVCALKSLTVLLSSDALLETLTTEVCTKTFPLSEEHSQERLNSLQTLLKSMVSYAVLPSPFKRVVSLRDLERAQSVLVRMPSSVHCNRKTAAEKKAASEGNTYSRYL